MSSTIHSCVPPSTSYATERWAGWRHQIDISRALAVAHPSDPERFG